MNNQLTLNRKLFCVIKFVTVVPISLTRNQRQLISLVLTSQAETAFSYHCCYYKHQYYKELVAGKNLQPLIGANRVLGDCSANTHSSQVFCLTILVPNKWVSSLCQNLSSTHLNFHLGRVEKNLKANQFTPIPNCKFLWLVNKVQLSIYGAWWDASILRSWGNWLVL